MIPTHAYIPGRTPRHPDGAFDVLRDTVRAGADVSALERCDAMLFGLRYLETGFYWEAHEVLEPVWMACPPNSAERSMAQALIQIANARLKQEMARPNAARRIAAIARTHLIEAERTGSVVLGLEVKRVALWIDSL